MSSFLEVAVQGVELGIGDGASPEGFTGIANIKKFTVPIKARKVDVSNVQDPWMRQITTLKEVGDLAVDIFYNPTCPTHKNSAGGLLYLFDQKTRTDFQVHFPDGPGNSLLSTLTVTAYVSAFSITAAVAGVFEAACVLSGTGAPTLP